MPSFGKIAIKPEFEQAFLKACQDHGLKATRIKGLIYELSPASALMNNSAALRQAVGMLGLKFGDFDA